MKVRTPRSWFSRFFANGAAVFSRNPFLPLKLWAKMVQTARLICGVPDYGAYVRHRLERHPNEPVMTYAQFFNERQAARYGRGRSRCC